MNGVLVLLPPSQGKAAGGTVGPNKNSFEKGLQSSRAQVLKALAEALSDGRAAQVLGAKGELLEHYTANTRLIIRGGAPVLPAWQRYNGVVWQGLDAPSLTKDQRARLLIPSGLYGLLRGDDDVTDYRLTMTARLPGIGKLGTYWQGPLAGVVSRQLARKTVVNLLPGEHREAVNDFVLDGVQVCTVSFVKSDGQGAAGHAAKKAKGRVARAVLEGGLEALGDFCWDGWVTSKIDEDWYQVTGPKRNTRVPPGQRDVVA